jgi:hypothetical protein
MFAESVEFLLAPYTQYFAVPQLCFNSFLKEINSIEGLTATTTSFTGTDVGSFIKFPNTACEDLNVS